MNLYKTYKAILFDFFDVVHADGFKRWMKDRGIVWEGYILQANIDMDCGKIDETEFLKRVAGLVGHTPKQFEAELKSYEKLNDEIIPLIDKLKEIYKIGLLSNAPSKYLRDLLKRHNLESHFHHIVISSEVGVAKPSPEIFEHLISKMKTTPKESIFIDDNSKYVAAAEKVGHYRHTFHRCADAAP